MDIASYTVLTNAELQSYLDESRSFGYGGNSLGKLCTSLTFNCFLSLEAIVSKDPLVDGAVMFGRGRAQNGIIVQPAARLKIDVSDPSQVEPYLDSIW